MILIMLMQNMEDDSMKKRAFILAGIVFSLVVLSSCIISAIANQNNVIIMQGEYPVYDTAEEIVSASDLVFSGTVTEIKYESLNVKSENGADSKTGLAETSEVPYTIFVINIEQVYKGSVDSDSISIKRPGGKMDGYEYVLEDASAIDIGETYLFITETYENSYPSLLNVTQASFNMSDSETTNISQEYTGITLSEVLEYLNASN